MGIILTTEQIDETQIELEKVLRSDILIEETTTYGYWYEQNQTKLRGQFQKITVSIDGSNHLMTAPRTIRGTKLQAKTAIALHEAGWTIL